MVSNAYSPLPAGIMASDGSRYSIALGYGTGVNRVVGDLPVVFVDVTQELDSTAFDTKVYYISPWSNEAGVRHTAGTSSGMMLDHKASTVYDTQLYIISGRWFLFTCGVILGLSLLIIVVLEGPGSIAWALALSQGYGSSAGEVEGNCLDRSVWIVRGNVVVLTPEASVSVGMKTFKTRGKAVKEVRNTPQAKWNGDVILEGEDIPLSDKADFRR
ncbi:hypothetical protein HDU98_003017 [Podochytrium sp. JEL0797]|nr:hypothetical protein HDU98_003017 [Podochytrium sp. JEL0797]